MQFFAFVHSLAVLQHVYRTEYNAFVLAMISTTGTAEIVGSQGHKRFDRLSDKTCNIYVLEFEKTLDYLITADIAIAEAQKCLLLD